MARVCEILGTRRNIKNLVSTMLLRELPLDP
jgi:hypothetical protein